MNPEYARTRELLAKNLLRLRNQKGWTQEQAANACEMNITFYGNLEREKHNATLITLTRLAQGFGVEVADLLVA